MNLHLNITQDIGRYVKFAKSSIIKRRFEASFFVKSKLKPHFATNIIASHYVYASNSVQKEKTHC